MLLVFPLLLCLMTMPACRTQTPDATDYYAHIIEEENTRMHIYYMPGDILRLDSCVAYFSTCTHKQVLLGEALYLRGATNDYLNHFAEAVHDLKQAEYVLLGEDDSITRQLLGRVYYKLGSSMESGQLYQQALQYYHRALPLLMSPETDSLFVACALRDIGRLGADRQARLDTLRMARTYAEGCGEELLVNDIREYEMLYDSLCPVDSLLSLSKRILFRYNRRDEAAMITDYYLRNGETDSAARYISFLSVPDPTQRQWHASNRPYYLSRYLRQTGMPETAYDLLLQLYDSLLVSRSLTAGTEILAIAQHYDLSMQTTRAEQAEQAVRMRTMIIVTLAIIFMLITVVLVLLRIVRLRREQAMQAKRESERLQQEQRTEQLRMHFITQMNTSLQFIKARMHLTRAYNIRIARGADDALTEWLQQHGQPILLTTEESMHNLMQDTDKACSGVLSKLAATYPTLTPTDIQLLTLMLLDANDEDIAILLDCKKESIYQRRTRIRSHIREHDGSSVHDLHAWIQAFFRANV